MVRPDPGELADDGRCPDEPVMPAAVFTDDHVGAAWNSQVRDAGTMCRWAFRDLARFAKGKAAKLWAGLRGGMADLAARARGV